MAIKHILIIVEDVTDEKSIEMIEDLEASQIDTDIDIFLIDQYESAISLLTSLKHPDEEHPTIN